jgi:NTE family protein
MTKTIRVALSGSGFLLPAHVGALHAIADAGYEPIEMAATSGGSIVASLACSGMPLDVMKDLAMTFDWSPMMSLSPWSALRLRGYCSGDKLLHFLHTKTHQLTFHNLVADLKIMASDIATKEPFVFSKATTPEIKIGTAARASAAIPLIYEPVILGDLILFDGGMVANMPADLLTPGDVPRIGIDLVSDASFMPPSKYSLLKALPRFIDMLMDSGEAAEIGKSELLGTRIIQVPTGFASSLDKKMALGTRERLFRVGYEATASAILLA